MSPHSREVGDTNPARQSTRNRLWALVHRRAVLRGRGESDESINEAIAHVVRRLERQGVTPIEVRIELREAEDNARQLQALYESESLTPNGPPWPSIPIRIEERRDNPMFDLLLIARDEHGQQAGELGLIKLPEQRLYGVIYGHVRDEYRRRGVYRRLVERASEISCEEGWQLASDTSLTPESEAFWRGGVRKAGVERKDLEGRIRYVVPCAVTPNAAPLTEMAHATADTPELLARLGLSHPEDLLKLQLGSGMMARAFMTPSGRVLKLTTDESDARVMALLKQAGRVPGLIKVFDVARMPGTIERAGTAQRWPSSTSPTPHRGKVPLYAVVVERVTTRLELAEPIREMDPEVAARFGGYAEAHELGKQLGVAVNLLAFEGAASGGNEERFSVPEMMREAERNHLGDAGLGYLEELSAGWLWMLHHGYHMRDLHEGNVGLTDDGHAVMLDLGLSQTARSQEPDIEIAANPATDPAAGAAAILSAWDRRKVTTQSAVRVLRAWARAKGWTEDRYGNFLLDGDERYHFTKQRIQRQKKYGGTWSNIKSTPLIDGATNLLIKAAETVSDEEALDKLRGAKTKRTAQKTERQEKARSERAEEEVRRQAIKMIASEMPLEFAVWHDTGRPPFRIGERFEQLRAQFETMRRLGGSFPDDGDLFSVSDPPFAPILIDVGPVEWVETHDGVRYTVTVEKSRQKDTAVIEIGATGGLGQRVDPIAGAPRMDTHGMNREGDAYLSGYIRRTDGGALGVLYFLISKDKQRGAGSRMLDLWCALMEAYGSAIWHARAVGEEGQVFLRKKVAQGRITRLGTVGPDEVYRCRESL